MKRSDVLHSFKYLRMLAKQVEFILKLWYMLCKNAGLLLNSIMRSSCSSCACLCTVKFSGPSVYDIHMKRVRWSYMDTRTAREKLFLWPSVLSAGLRKTGL